MNRAVGVKTPQETQKAKALWKMKAAKDAGEEYYDPECEDNILERNKTRLALWEEHLKDPIVALDKALKCVEKIVLEGLGPISLWRERSPMAGDGFLLSLWKKPIWKGIWAYLGPMGGVCLRAASVEWNVPVKYGPHDELFFFLIPKEPASMPSSETFSPCLNADIRTPFLC